MRSGGGGGGGGESGGWAKGGDGAGQLELEVQGVGEVVDDGGSGESGGVSDGLVCVFRSEKIK